MILKVVRKLAAFSFSFKICTNKRVCSCKEKIDVHICLSDFVFLVHKRVKNELFVLLKKQKKDCVLSIRRKLKKKSEMTSIDL